MPVELAGVGHRFPDAEWLFRHVTLKFSEGSTYALTGPSGSGKSTLLGIIAGWSRPTEGSVLRQGVDRVSWVFQNSYGVPRRSAIDHVAIPLLAAGETRKEALSRADELLHAFRLSHVSSREFRELSGGEAQRLMLARAVAANPQLLLVDEPTAQLDSATSRVINEVMTSLAEQGRVVLVATHDPGTAESCDEHIDLSNFPSSNMGPAAG